MNINLRFKTHLKNILFKKRFLGRLNHNIKSFRFKSAITPACEFDDSQLIERLTSRYPRHTNNGNGMWGDFFQQLQGDIHAAFIAEDHEKIADILRNPKDYNLYYGFENLSKDLINNKRLEDILEPEMAMDSLLSLCEAVGVINISNPESVRIKKAMYPDDCLQLLEAEFGFNLDIPNPFEGECGIVTKRGILSYRAVQAIYQAWRISEFTKDKVLEIGGGLGRTAYYCHLFGIHDYTIVDIPISSLAQGNFLGRVLPDADIKLITPEAFLDSNTRYDLVVNVDGLTELDIDTAKDYLHKISQVGSLFLSMNHENNPFSVHSIQTKALNKLYRHPSWVRRGYVEELFQSKP